MPPTVYPRLIVALLLIINMSVRQLHIRSFMLSKPPRFSSGHRYSSTRQASTTTAPVHPPEGMNAKKFIVVTGGVISGIGKGVTASSIGVLLKMMNIRPTAIKIDPYLNADAGTMSPFEHGEVFVLDDGGETDLDLGNYERFLDVRLTNNSNLTTGKIYQAVIAKERRGDYLGKTVQIIPHITNEIIERILSVTTQPVDSSAMEPEVCVIELGGTIGDIESMPFVEALRQLQLRVRPENFCLVHVSMVPTVGDAPGEQKTKPTQHSVKELRSLGLSPDFIVCRGRNAVSSAAREKISMFCNVPFENVLSVHDVSNIYHVPMVMLEQSFHSLLSRRLQLHDGQVMGSGVELNSTVKEDWTALARVADTAQRPAKVALVGKYTSQLDSYLSVISALKHACIATEQKLDLVMVESSHLEEQVREESPGLYDEAWTKLTSADAVLVPGGFGIRGIEGKISAIKYAREKKVPFLGICLGMQACVIEYSRTFLGKPTANSREFAPDITDDNSAIVFMPEVSKEQLGGTMRLGARRTLLRQHSRVHELYDFQDEIVERHRHRYEVNPSFVSPLEEKGLLFSGRDDTHERMEAVELAAHEHPYFVAVQFHPEFVSRPLRPAPVFHGLLRAVQRLQAVPL